MSGAQRNTLGVLLAAGAGSRFSGPTHKLVTPMMEEPVIVHSLRALRDAQFADIVVITGSADLSDHLSGVTTVHNPEWATGQRGSVLCAIAYARHHLFDSVVIGLADQPFISSESWMRVASSESPIAVATYDGVRSNPVKLHSSVWDLFENTESPADEGARALIRLHPTLVSEVVCEGNYADIDTTEDVEKWT
jgi:molybdenum cofactor cytidylyltransferase